MEKSKAPRQGSPDYYRQRASEMLKLAEEAATEEARSSLLNLAAGWNQLAQQTEHPGW